MIFSSTKKEYKESRQSVGLPETISKEMLKKYNRNHTNSIYKKKKIKINFKNLKNLKNKKFEKFEKICEMCFG